MITIKKRALGAVKPNPYRIDRLYNVYSVIQIGTNQVMGKFNSLEEAEAFLFSLTPRLK